MKRLLFIILIFVFVISFVNDEIVASSVLESIIFCVNTIVPSLYIYMIISEAFVEYNAFGQLSDILYKYLKIDVGKSNKISVFILSLICGAPIGAKLSYGAYKKGSISKKDAIVLNCMTNNISLSFVFGVCSRVNEYYYVAFVVQIITSLICAFVLSKTIKIDKTKNQNIMYNDYTFKTSEIIKNATSSMINVCASIVMFSFFGDIIGLYIPILQKYIKGLFEFSSGIMLINKKDLVTMTAFLSFGGFSVHNQIMSLWCGELKYQYLLIPKILQTILSVCFCEIFLLFVDNPTVLL